VGATIGDYAQRAVADQPSSADPETGDQQTAKAGDDRAGGEEPGVPRARQWGEVDGDPGKAA
jgi:hypothetical protein